MKKHWIKLILFVAPLFLLLVGMNYYVDPSNLFHSVNQSMAQAMAEGECVSASSGNVNERLLRYYMVQEMPQEPDCIVLGGSSAACINPEIADETTFYNLAVTSDNIYDLLAMLGLLEAYDIHPKRIIIAVDTFLFDEEGTSLWEIYSDYAYYMEDLLDGENAAVPKRVIRESNEANQLFSLSYFQSSVDYIRKYGRSDIDLQRYEVISPDDLDDLNAMGYMPDGSRIYSKTAREVDADYVASYAESYDMSTRITADYSIPEERADMFERILDYLDNNGCEVELYISPYAPSMWDRVDLDKYGLLLETEEYALELATERGLKITGSFNPYHLGMTDADFYDAFHVRREVLDTFFDFTE